MRVNQATGIATFEISGSPTDDTVATDLRSLRIIQAGAQFLAEPDDGDSQYDLEVIPGFEALADKLDSEAGDLAADGAIRINLDELSFACSSFAAGIFVGLEAVEAREGRALEDEEWEQVVGNFNALMDFTEAREEAILL